MFTGIIQNTSRVLAVQKKSSGILLGIRRPFHWKLLKRGESIAVDGVCLTLTTADRVILGFDIIKQTLMRTTLTSVTVGSVVNLERSLRASDLIGGHIVAGHVDAVGRVARVISRSNDYRITIQLPKELMKFCPVRGSVAINGVSLTIAASSRTRVTVALTDYTLQHTNLGVLKRGDIVNVEIDLIAGYLEKLYKTKTPPLRGSRGSKIPCSTDRDCHLHN